METEREIREMDDNLSVDQQKEWNAIFASYKSKSVLTGKVTGVDFTKVRIWNGETGQYETVECHCLVIVSYRVKVIIPESEIWADNNQRPGHVIRSMFGATVDYVITDIDRKNNCCIASRKLATYIRRNSFKHRHFKVGDRININVIAVGKNKLLVTTNGFDVSLTQIDLSYSMIRDLRDRYHVGNTHTAILKSYDEEKETIEISVKEAEPHPFIGADVRHPVGSRRASQIMGKYAGGVFCNLDDNLTCFCTYSRYHADEDFNIGDNVIVVITRFNYEKKQVYGKIVAKW